MRLYKVSALFKLGMEDLTKNMSVFIYVLLPLVMGLLYSNLDGISPEYNYSFSVLMNLAVIPVTLMGTIIAEEKEKNTLRTLMLNDVKALEILSAKALICLIFMLLDNILLFFIVGLPMNLFVLYQIPAVFTAIALLFFGAFVGLMAKNQMSAGLLSLPFMVVFLAPLFVQMMGNDLAKKISSAIATDGLMKIYLAIAGNDITFSSIGLPIIVIVAWLVFSVVLFQIAYKKVKVDN
ncbi:MAG: ABC transporter permease [Lachnospiraceae bacterium]|nr:ABC transporter permease [Lachnospiraceae bacterium]